MAVGSLGLEFSINQFPVQGDFDVRINIREDFNFLRYGSEFGLQNVGVSFLDSDPINVNNNLIIKDSTSSVPENSPLSFSETIYTSQNFDIGNAKFLITDVIKTESTGDETPLYYRHDLSTYSSISNIEVLDGDFNPVNNDLFLYADEEASLGFARKSVYTNLRSDFDSVAQTYTVYYIRFKDDSSGAFITELLNPKPFYEESTFSTAATDRAYTVTPTFGNAGVVVHFDSRTYSPTPLSGSHRFSVKVEGDRRVSIVRPADLPATEKWYLRINPGEFFKNTVDGDARYYVPEYEQQLFSPVAPFKLLVEKEARVITSRLLYLEPKPISNLGIDGFYLYVIIRNKFGQTVRALTNDPNATVYTRPDGVITNVFFEKDAIQSIAEEDGFIRLETDIPVDADVYITYRYSEAYLTYRGINVNSTGNPKILNNKIVVYVTPEFSSTLAKTVYHIMVDENDLILDGNQTEDFLTVEGTSTGGSINTLNDTSLSVTDIYTGFELEVLSGTNAGRKLKITGYVPGSKEITVAENFESSMVAGTKYRINKKLNSYSYEDSVSSTVFNYDGWLETYLSSPNHYVVLGDVFAIQTIAPQDISKSDIRIRGGGLKSTSIDDALRLQDEVQWYWDIGYWDGQPYPGMGGILVELPRSILKEVGGSFSREQVLEIVERHMAHGSYPIIKYYDRSTRITDVQPSNQKIFLSWLNVGAAAYNIYVGQNPDQLSLYRAVAGVITELEIEDLENDKVYYIMVESVVGGVAQLPSRIAFAIPFDPTTTKPPAVYGETDYSGGTYSSG